MTKDEYLAAIKALGLNQLQAALALGISPRQSQRLASGENAVSPTIEKLLGLLAKQDLAGDNLYTQADLAAAIERRKRYQKDYIRQFTRSKTPS